jgi:hypothetical protein
MSKQRELLFSIEFLRMSFAPDALKRLAVWTGGIEQADTICPLTPWFLPDHLMR